MPHDWRVDNCYSKTSELIDMPHKWIVHTFIGLCNPPPLPNTPDPHLQNLSLQPQGRSTDHGWEIVEQDALICKGMTTTINLLVRETRTGNSCGLLFFLHELNIFAHVGVCVSWYTPLSSGVHNNSGGFASWLLPQEPYFFLCVPVVTCGDDA